MADTPVVGYIESHYSWLDKAVLRLANVVALRWPFGYRTVGGTWPLARLYWWAMCKSYTWNEIQIERRA